MGNRSEKTSCLVEQSVNAALGNAFDEAEALLLRQLGHVTLADLLADFNRRFDEFKRTHPHPRFHHEHEHDPV